MEIKKIGIIGSGTMGAGIAQIVAQAGYDVCMVGVDGKDIAGGMEKIKKSLDKGIEKGKITAEDKKNILKKIKTSTEINSVSDSQVVIEAVFEDIELKKDIFKKLDNACNKETILATNTSSLSVSEIASVTERSKKVIGMHFFNPAEIMKLVEIVNGKKTSEETYTIVKDLAIKLGKTPVAVNDSPAFVGNRILMPMINEAIYALQEGIATKEDIDTVMKLGMGHPIGPLELADLIGLDICLDILKVLYKKLGEKYKPCPLLVEKVKRGELGKKTKKGFYDY